MVGFMNRDAYGFSVRPQHVQRYREYVNIYKVLSISITFIFYSENSFLHDLVTI